MHKHIILSGLLLLLSTLAGLAQDTIYLKPYFRDLKTIDVFIKGKKYDFLFDAGGGETTYFNLLAARQATFINITKNESRKQ